MGFVDPRTDFGFKRIFGSSRSKPTLRKFLNAIIYDNEPRIADLEITDPYQNPDLYSLKQSILDIKAVLNDETIVIIEMQILPVEAFAERVVYNTAKAYVSQLKRGEGYLCLKPVISVTITDFVLFPRDDGETKPITRYQLLDAETGHCCSDHLELIFAELPKLAKQPEQLGKASDLWLYFIQQAGRVEQVPEVLTRPEFDDAFAIANESQLSQEEYELAEKQRMKLLDAQGQLSYAIKEGMAIGRAQGIEQGLAEGLEQGLEQGLAEGLEQGLINAARGMLLAGVNVETVCQGTGLTREVVQRLANEVAGEEDG